MVCAFDLYRLILVFHPASTFSGTRNRDCNGQCFRIFTVHLPYFFRGLSVFSRKAKTANVDFFIHPYSCPGLYRAFFHVFPYSLRIFSVLFPSFYRPFSVVRRFAKIPFSVVLPYFFRTFTVPAIITDNLASVLFRKITVHQALPGIAQDISGTRTTPPSPILSQFSLLPLPGAA